MAADSFTPLDFGSSNLKLWLDASQLTSMSSNWLDSSGNQNHAIRDGSPALLQNAQNGLPVIHYNANGQRHRWTEIDDIRTVFWVISIDQAYSSSGFRYLLSSTYEHPDFHNDDNGKLFGSRFSDTHVKNGSTWLNGTSVNGMNTNQPTSLAIISHKTTGNVKADSFGNDRGMSDRQWIGKLGEILIFNVDLSDADIQKIEGYLAHKWRLYENLPLNILQQADNLLTGEFYVQVFANLTN